MSDEDLLAQVRRLMPDLAVETCEIQDEGQANAVAIINDRYVFRFPKNDDARKALEQEAKVLAVAPHHIDLPLPDTQYFLPDAMVQQKVAGDPLDRHELMRQVPSRQERLVASLARFLYQLHRVPADVLREAAVGPSPAWQGHPDAEVLYHECEAELFPYLKSYAKSAIRSHFEPVLAGSLRLDYDPVLIHGDLNPGHILWDRKSATLCGVIDFGMAGFGDSALDYAAMIISYGETPLQRMHRYHPSIGEKLDRARFWATAIEMQWALAGVRTGDAKWFTSHLGTARDMLPIGTPWV